MALWVMYMPWKGKKSGAGEMEITKLTEGQYTQKKWI